MELWVAIRGTYSDAQPVGVATSKEAAEDLVRADYWRRHPDYDRSVDPLDDYTTGDVDGPFQLGELKVGW